MRSEVIAAVLEALALTHQSKMPFENFGRGISALNVDFLMRFGRTANKTPYFHLLGTDFDLHRRIPRKSTPKLGAK